jgi:hypothetical protein
VICGALSIPQVQLVMLQKFGCYIVAVKENVKIILFKINVS